MATTEQLAPDVAARAPRSEPTSNAASTATATALRPGGWWAPVAVILVALSPFVVGAVSIVRRGFPPGALFGDRALIALTAHDAWEAPALLGPYSRFFWHHPGPLYFHFLRLWSVFFGDGTVAIVLGATAINVLGAVGILLLAHRRGGRPLLVWTSLLLTAYLVVIQPDPFDVWNPSVTLLPFVALLLLSWSVACRDWWMLPWLAFVGSFVVQTHVGLAPGTAAAIGFAIVVGVLRWRRDVASRTDTASGGVDAERRRMGRAGLVGVAVIFVAWLPPLIQEATGREGNLSALARFFTQPGSAHTLSEALTNSGLQATLMLRGLFLPISLRADTRQLLTIALVVSAVAYITAVVSARRLRAGDTLALLALVAIELAVGVYAMTRIAGPIQYYLVQWISAVGFVLWVALGRAALEFARARAAARPPSQSVMRAFTAVVLVILCVGALRAFPAEAGLVNEDLDVPNDRALFGYVPTQQLLAATREGRTVVLRLDRVTAWEIMAADALLLVQHGRAVKVVETKETRLLFDESLLVERASREQVLAFRDRPQPRDRDGETLVADQGAWSIVSIPAR